MRVPEKGAIAGAYSFYAPILRGDIRHPVNDYRQQERRKGCFIRPEQGAIPGSQGIDGPIFEADIDDSTLLAIHGMKKSGMAPEQGAVGSAECVEHIKW